MKNFEFADWLNMELEKQGLSQRDLADISDINHSTISRITRRERDPFLFTASALVEALGYDLIIRKKDEKVKRT